MKPLAIAAALAVIALATGPAAMAKPARIDPQTMQAARELQFGAVSKLFLDAAAQLSPTEATVIGDHRYDDRLPDITAAGRAAKVEKWRDLLGQLRGIDPTSLKRETQVDYAMLRNELEYRIWSNDTLEEWAWNPMYYNDIIGGSLYGLAARDFAPWDVRLRAATARMEAMPALVAEVRRQLVPAQVPKVFAETVARQNTGAIDIAQDMLAPHRDALTPADRARFDAALQNMKAVIWDHQQWLEKTLVPQAAGDFRIGARRYDQKMKFGLVSAITRPQLKAKALKAKADTRAEMYVLATKVLADRADAPPLPRNPTANQQQAAIEAALQLSYAKRPSRDRLEQRARETLAEATEFVRAKGLIRMPDGPVRVITMPKFQQGFSVAYNDPPGPLEKGLQNFYAVSPVPAEWSDAQATSFLSEYNDYMIHDLSIHEAMPGHYLQLDHSNRNPSVLRAYLGSGPFIEGWAVYAEGVMKDEGYLNSEPLFQLTILKMRLRSITNTLLDIGIHTEGMTRDQAMELMMKGAFQQEREAAGKWIRASLSSVQLLSYFTGYEEHLALRAEAQKRWGKDFNLRRYHDTVLGYGSPPAKYVRALMFDQPVR